MTRSALTFPDIRTALRHLRGRVSDRKWRLLAVAACRHVYPASALTPEWAAALDVVERLANGEAGAAELARVLDFRAAGQAGNTDWWAPWRDETIIRGAVQTAGFAAAWTCVNAALHACSDEVGDDMRQAPDRMADLLYDICGHLSTEAPFEPRWRTPDAVRLAAEIYQARSFDTLPYLGDALEEAGCADRGVLGHLRGGGLHVRGCWALDLVLGHG